MGDQLAHLVIARGHWGDIHPRGQTGAFVFVVQRRKISRRGPGQIGQPGHALRVIHIIKGRHEKVDVFRNDPRAFGQLGENMIRLAFAVLLMPNLALADIETARDLMEAGEFGQAKALLEPAARSGNADAEELIGVMYAMGLGLAQDDTRAFEWYLRAAMKGHPGAQSGVGWYYEVGRGVAAPDLVRAYMWYVLSAIGGDPDAAISQEEVVKKMTAEEIEKAHVLVDDYRVWLYPFR